MQINPWAAIGSILASQALILGLYLLTLYLKYQRLATIAESFDCETLPDEPESESPFIFVNMRDKASSIDDATTSHEVQLNEVTTLSFTSRMAYIKGNELCDLTARVQSIHRRASLISIRKKVEEVIYMIHEPEAAPLRERIGDYLGFREIQILEWGRLAEGEHSFSPEILVG